MKITTTKVFDKTLNAFVDDDIRHIISYGGTSSSKTISILQLLMLYGFKHPDKRIAIVAENIPVIKRNIINDLSTKVFKDNWIKKQLNKSDLTYTLPNNTIFQFLSASNPDSYRGFRSDIAYFDEISNIPKETFDQITMRCKEKIISSFNPTNEFYILDYFADKDVKIIKSNYLDNQYLDKRIIKDILNKAEKSEIFKRVYVDGEFGSYEGAVFKEDINWEVNYDRFVMPSAKHYKFRRIGIDFGFVNDPTTIIDVRYYNNILYVNEITYKTGLLTKDIIKILKDNKLENIEIRADNSEPREIETIRQAGFNIKGVKYRIMDSINALLNYKLKVSQYSINTIKELRNYHYKKDKLSGKYKNEPIDMFNHSIDAIRYAITDKLYKKDTNFRIVQI